MFIQCQHCNAAFKIDESKIPDQNAFVRCVKCSNPIPLNKQKQTAIAESDPHKIVECSNCESRYSIPLDKLEKESVKVRCGKCGHVFQVSRSGEEQLSGEISDPFETEADSDTGELDDEISFEDDIGLNDISIPEENEIEMDSLYDNIDEASIDEETETDETFEDPIDFEEDSEQSEEYLDSISLSAQVGDEEITEEDDDDLELDTVSSEERYKLFLKPDGKTDEADAALTGDDEQWPEVEDETEMLDMGQEISDFTGLDEMGELPDLDETSARASLTQPIEGKKKRKSRWVFIFLIVIFAIIAATGWFYFQSDAGREMFPQITERYDSKSKLKIQEPLKGRMIFNKSDKVNIFLLEGQVKNTYPSDVDITWIEIKGVLYDQQNEKISEAFTNAGINLTNAQLVDWSEDRIKSYVKYQSDKVKQELVIKSGSTAPFQIVFFKVPKTINKLEASINRFGRAEK